jgi:hypothetical protein
VQDGFLVGVLHAFSYPDEQLQPLEHGHFMLVAVDRDGNAADKLHHEVRPAFRR